jgi:adenosylcobinamide kinase/adenosylcobinamide-phosphate guanylyltransferase/adenosylcobyric acid synthase
VRIILVTGGARAGKSRWAEREATRLGGDDVAFVATAEAGDDEMARRIAAHRAERSTEWTTVEAPIRVPRAVRDAPCPVVILDCLTLWVSNLLVRDGGAEEREDRIAVETGQGGREEADLGDGIRHRVEALLEVARRREGTLIVVTNEVGLGVVPDNRLARAYRDLLGWANACVAREADRVVLLVAGIPIVIRDDGREGYRALPDHDLG